MLPVVWRKRARTDLLDIVEYIGEHNPAAARRLAHEFESCTWALSAYPNLYRLSQRIPGCREIVVHKKYIVIYRVEPDRVRVMRIVHGSRVHL